MARIRRPGEQVTTTRPTRRVPGRNNRGGGGGGGGGGGRNPGLTNVQKNRRGARNKLAAADPVAPPSSGDIPNDDTSIPDTITSISNQDPAAYLQARLGSLHGGLTGGTSYDNWLNNNYIPGQVGAFNQNKIDTGNPKLDFDAWLKQREATAVADAQFQYAHRPDTQRELNPFEGGGSHWSWFD